MARLENDIPAQVENAKKVIALGAQLKNSQLFGQAHEVLGLAALDRKDNGSAWIDLKLAQDSFQSLKQYRDEARVLRDLLPLAIAMQQSPTDIHALTQRFVSLSNRIEREDRADAAEDFGARLRYAENQFQVERLEAEAKASKEREKLLLQNS
ncbi:hypothetical protein HC761_01385, partial [bacterium]|nr:hypothetical protein [bacterium]